MKLFSFLVPVPDFRSRQLHRSSWGQLVITSWPAWRVHSSKSTLFYLTQKVWLFTQASWENSTLRLNENWLCSRGRSFKSYSSYVCGSLDEYLHSVLFFIFQVLFLYISRVRRALFGLSCIVDYPVSLWSIELCKCI